jgi:hypothetical protein
MNHGVLYSTRRPQKRHNTKAGFGGAFLGIGLLMALATLAFELPIGYAIIGGGLVLIGSLVLFTEFTKGSLALVLLVLVAGCGVANASKPDWFKDSELLSNDIAHAANSAVPYPIEAVKAGGFLERKNQVEKLKRFSNPNKLGFVYVMSFGKFIGYYAIKGKVSAVNSSLTNVNQTWDCGADCQTVVDSIGDDGTFGPNEGGDRGKFFFTTGGVMVLTDLDIMYVDKPLEIGNIPQLYQ